MRALACLAALSPFLCLLPVAPARAQAPAERHVRGDVIRLDGDRLELRTAAGEAVSLRLAPDLGVARVEPADASAIAEGAFIGTAAVPQPDGTLRATEVHVFPESMRGTGEGERPWDLPGGGTMANATVKHQGAGTPAPSRHGTMANATVARAAPAGGAGRTLTLSLPGGERTVLLPPGTPVVRLVPGDRSLLVPGAHVFALAVPQGDGSLLARRLTVGQGAVRPPM